MGFALAARHLTALAILILYNFFMLGIGLSFGNIMTNGLHRLSQEQQADGNAIFNTVQQFAAAIGSRPGRSRRQTTGHHQRLTACTDSVINHRRP